MAAITPGASSAVIDELSREVARRVSPDQLAAADRRSHPGPVRPPQ
jgi:hypothetical protein